MIEEAHDEPETKAADPYRSSWIADHRPLRLEHKHWKPRSGSPIGGGVTDLVAAKPLPPGVKRNGDRFVAMTRVEGRVTYLGTFATADEADARVKAERAPKPKPPGVVPKLPRGVSLNGRRFTAKITIEGKYVHLGTFDTPALASAAVHAALASRPPRTRTVKEVVL